YMMENGKKVPFKFFFGASSCVPATTFETAGAVLGIEETEELLKDPEILYLSEMMNFPGVLYQDPQVMQKLGLARKYGKPTDGHSPGLTGTDAAAYAGSGITTDHECFTLEEALEKISYGMKILIREGSAAKNFEALSELFRIQPSMIMLCSDDKHPDDLVKGHINLLVKRALKMGYDFFDVIRSCTVNPVEHYRLSSGLLQKGSDADFIVIDNPDDFTILETWVRGGKVAENGRSLIPVISERAINNFNTQPVTEKDLELPAHGEKIRVIEATDGQLITGSSVMTARIEEGMAVSDPQRDILKIVVKNRYMKSLVSVAFVKGFGLKEGAMAGSVAHDSHNIIAVGCDDHSILLALNSIIDEKGGIAVTKGTRVKILPLPVAGIMTARDGYETARLYERINQLAKDLGSPLNAPFMTLSFMALLVIPDLKISDKGLFDGKLFNFVEIFEK
ncbi:MAG: adenine deaminase C-terminal domain-containing protein, partial [Syntrophothermus sp.]